MSLDERIKEIEERIDGSQKAHEEREKELKEVNKKYRDRIIEDYGIRKLKIGITKLKMLKFLSTLQVGNQVQLNGVHDICTDLGRGKREYIDVLFVPSLVYVEEMYSVRSPEFVINATVHTVLQNGNVIINTSKGFFISTGEISYGQFVRYFP